MITKKTDVLIIGGGLTGLTLAYFLKKQNISFKIVEARNRLGGRIKTVYSKNEAPIELGATWLIDQQSTVLNLLKELNVEVFEQEYGTTAIYHPNPNQAAQLVQLPNNSNKSYRIKGGTHKIISALEETLDSKNIDTNQPIETVTLFDDGIEATSRDYKYSCKHIVSTLPPLLLSKTIKFKPSLPDNLKAILDNTHTWMHDSIRVGFTYKNAFWKNENTSGTIYSSVGPLQEFYDPSDADKKVFALGGFMNNSFSNLSKDERKSKALQQLQGYYGDIALDYITYEECDWKSEQFTSIKSDSFLMPQTNNGNPIFENSFLNNRFFIAGTETSFMFPGKMEGAVISAIKTFNKIKSMSSK